VKKRVRNWKVKDRQAYGYLVKACESDPSAMEVLLKEDLENASARTLLAELKERFNQEDMIGVVQAKLSAFNSLSGDWSQREG
jgi:transposase-like protein